MLSKFLLILLLAKLLPVSELGTYGLLVAAVGFAVLLIGFDYYSYSNREILSANRERWPMIVSNQIYAYLLLYFLFIPISILIYYFNFLPDGHFIWFFILAIVEHISLEQNRLLNTLQKQLSASTVLFLRSGLWVLCMLPFMVYIDALKNLETVLYFWLLGGLSSIVFGTFTIKKVIKNIKLSKPEYKWILKGYKTGFFFILGTLALTAISTGDKFFLEKLSSTEMVGVYTFYTAIIIGATAFINAGVIVFSAPRIIRAYQQGKMYKYKYLMHKFFLELLFATIIMVVLLYFFMPFVLTWIEKPYYSEFYDVFYIILGTAALIILRSYPDTYLYASKRDSFIVLTNISGLLIFIGISILLYYYNESIALYKVSISVLITFLWLFMMKFIGYIYYSRYKSS